MKWFRYSFMGFMVLVMVGCTAANYQTEFASADNRVLIEDVPFYADDRFWCGPATLTAVLNYHGDEVSLETVTDAIYSESARGTVPFDMVWYAGERGFNVVETEGTWEGLRDRLRRDQPVIVFSDKGGRLVSFPHYMIVVGISDDFVAVHSGTEEQKILTRDRFEEVWARQDNWMMVVH